MWARAMYTYDKVAKNIGPKKEALAQAEGELAVVQSELGKKQEALQKVGRWYKKEEGRRGGREGRRGRGGERKLAGFKERET